MMASRKTAAAPQRPRARGSKKGATNQYLYMAIGGAVVVILVVVLLTTGRNQPAPTQAKASTSEEAPKKHGKATAVERTARRSRRGDRAATRRTRRSESDREERQRTRPSSTRRSESGGFVRSSSRRSTSNPHELKAIIVDATGSRYALIGDKRLKPGDDVEGRRIVEVGADAVKVEYRTTTYTVRVGQTIY
ncbi:MAG: hypothetical protein ABIK86_07580 [candidate division WOR-3 bacterium]